MTAQGPRKGEPSLRSMRNGLRPQPARLVRGSSRRIMSMRFRPANIRVINRRDSYSAVIGSAVQTRNAQSPPTGTCSRYAARRRLLECQNGARRARVRFAAPKAGAPLPAARRSGQQLMRRAASMRWPGVSTPFALLPSPSSQDFGHWIGDGQGRAEGALVSALTGSGQCLT